MSAINERIGQFLEKTGIDEKLSAEERVELLREIDGAARQENRKIGFQAKALRVLLMVAALAWVGLWWRISRVEEVALAKAYMIQVDRVRVGATAVSRALDVVLSELTKWVEIAAKDTQTTPEDRAIRIANLERLGETVRTNRQQYDQIAKHAKEIGLNPPKKITAETTITDPLTGLSIPLNATQDGRLDEIVVSQVLGREDLLTAYLMLAKQYGGRGAGELPRNLVETPSPVQLDPKTLDSVGVKISVTDK